VLRPLDGELVEGEPVVGGRIGKVGEPHIVAHRLPAALVLDPDPAHQQTMEGAVSHQLGRGVEVEHLAHGVLARPRRHLGIEPLHRLAQRVLQHHLAKIAAPGVIRIRGHIVAADSAITHLGQPPHNLLFQLVFGHPLSILLQLVASAGWLAHVHNQLIASAPRLNRKRGLADGNYAIGGISK